jgi:hypothetical protein
METIATTRGRVMGIGELIVSSNTLPSEIPLLSFIVVKIREEDKRFPVFIYASTCIQLRMDGYGGSVKEAIDDMCGHCAEYFETLFTDEKCKPYAWRNLRELFHLDETSLELQNAYNDVCLNLAERGKYTGIIKTLTAIIAEKDAELARLRAKDKRESDKDDIFVKVIQYKEVA